MSDQRISLAQSVRDCTASKYRFNPNRFLHIMHTWSHQVGVFGAKFQIGWFSGGRSLAAAPQMIGPERFSQPPIIETRFNNLFTSTKLLSLLLSTALFGPSSSHFASDYGLVGAKHATLSSLFSPSNSFLFSVVLIVLRHRLALSWGIVRCTYCFDTMSGTMESLLFVAIKVLSTSFS